MNARLIYVRLLLVILLAMAAPRLWAQDGLRGALSQADFSGPFSRSLAAADFDNDHLPDGAVLINSGGIRKQSNFRIELHLTSHENTELTFESNQTALELVALDIDHDGDTDVIVQQAFTHKRLHVWINDGNGAFHEQQTQDFPPPALDTHEHLNLPSNQPDGPSPGLPPQRGFEIAVLITLPLLSRPPTKSKFHGLSTASAAASPDIAAHSSRAPPPA